MVAVSSTMLMLGTKATDFKLPDYNGKIYQLNDFDPYKALLIMFICNHCPFVKHVRNELTRIAVDYQKRGLAIVGINANDVKNYPEDSVGNMKKFAQENQWSFPYLYDETQEVAKAYKAACTPDFFLFNEKHLLVYRGQLDDSRPSNDKPVTGQDLREALEALLTDKSISYNQKPSIGCNIKWKSDNEPDYFSR